MMEVDVVSQDTSQTSPLTGARDTPSVLPPPSVPPSSSLSVHPPQSPPPQPLSDQPSLPSPPSLPSSPPLSSPPLPSLPPPSRPCRPKPPPPVAKASQLPSRPPLPPSLPPSLPPPLKPAVTKPCPPPGCNVQEEKLSPPLSTSLPSSLPPPLTSNPPPPSLPPPLAPIPASPSLSPPPPLCPASPTTSPPVSSELISSLPPPLSPTPSSPPPLLPSVPPSPPVLSHTERLVGSASVWQLKELGSDKTNSILEREAAGVFLVQSTKDQGMMLSVRLPTPDREGAPLIHNLAVKQHKTFLHLQGSCLVFDDIFKLVSFYCVSRDILPVHLRLPRVIGMATKSELEVISGMGADFWMSVLNHQAEGQDMVLDQEHSSHLSLSTTQIQFCYINPVTVEEHVKDPSPGSNPVPTSKLQNAASSSAHGSKLQNAASSSAHGSKSENTTSNSSHDCNLQNGGSQKKSEVKEQSKGAPNPEILPRYKRPPPRPPSLGSASGLASSCSLAAAAERKEEGSMEESGRKGGGGGDREERKLTSTSSAPLRPPVPAQGRPAPRLPPAPLQRASSRKSTGGEETREKGHILAENNEGGGGKTAEEKKGTNSTSMDGVVQDAGSSYGSDRREDKEARAEGEEGKEKEEDREEKQVKTEKGREEEKQKSSSNLHPSVKKPSRPVPPPRRKTPSQPAPLCPNPIGGGSPNQGAGIKMAPPSPSRRPDVSLYSPQGGAVVGTDPDSCSTSSTEEEGETNQEQEQNQSRSSDSRSPKASVKRTSTTIILDRARHRLSTVLTGLISHDRRLTQRLVELARDPVSYFGNLVKEHRAFTLETMSRHSSSTELLQEIRQMMTQLKSYLLQSTELQALIEPQHQYTQDKLEAIVEVALCKSVLKPLREPIYRSLETLHTEDGSLQQLAQNQSLVLGSTTTALGVTTAVPEAPAMEKISSKLNSLHLEYSPQRKIELLLKTCKIIYDSMSVSSPGRAHGADDFLPVMMYALARSNLANLQLDVEYMMELMDPSLTLGEGSYYLTTTYGALEHFKSFDQQRAATRQLSREVQDSIHRWERRRTLNKERMAQGSVQDFLTVCCPEMGSNPKTLGVLPGTTIQELTEQCAGRFEQESYRLSVCVEGVTRALDPTELALSVKNSMSPGAYCFVYHPGNQPNNQVSNYQSDDQPLDTPEESSCHDNNAIAISTSAAEEEEDSLISL